MPTNEATFKTILPPAAVVDRTAFLSQLVGDKRVAHIGFVDHGYREAQDARGTWLHSHLNTTARSIVGIDLDEAGVELARAEGFDAYAADCRDPRALRALGLEAFDLIVAGEVIEHIDEPGAFLDGLHALATPEGRLCVTTPNAYSAVNTLAALVGVEVIHPDHIALYSWRTLTELLRRHGWRTVRSLTYVSPPAPTSPAASFKRRVQTNALNAVLRTQSVVARARSPFVADGLIVVCQQGD